LYLLVSLRQIRELGVLFQPTSNLDNLLTFTPTAGQVGPVYVSAVVHVVKDAAVCGQVEVGDAVVRVNGGTVHRLSFPGDDECEYISAIFGIDCSLV
jgi:hypothetical protein